MLNGKTTQSGTSQGGAAFRLWKNSLNITGWGLSALLCVGFAHSAIAQDSERQAYEPSFELRDWYLGLPVDEDGDGKSDSISETKLAQGWTDPRFFFPSEDGGITFRAPSRGATTSSNTKYVRTELREMLRAGNTSHSTQGASLNN